MARIDLNEEDARILNELLTGALSDLRYEIANTDSQDYRDKLRKKQTLLESVIAQLAG